MGLLALVLAIVIPVGMGVVYYVRWAMSELEYIATRYASMCFLGRLAGVGMRPQNTPWEYCARLSLALPEHTEAITHITQRFVNTRYGGPSERTYAEEMWSLRAYWRTVLRALLGRILLRLFLRR